MLTYLKNSPAKSAKFHPIPIWNNEALGLFVESGVERDRYLKVEEQWA